MSDEKKRIVQFFQAILLTFHRSDVWPDRLAQEVGEKESAKISLIKLVYLSIVNSEYSKRNLKKKDDIGGNWPFWQLNEWQNGSCFYILWIVCWINREKSEAKVQKKQIYGTGICSRTEVIRGAQWKPASQEVTLTNCTKLGCFHKYFLFNSNE